MTEEDLQRQPAARTWRNPVALLAVAVLAIASAFVALPLVAIVFRTTPGLLIEQLGTPVFRDALRVSVISSVVAHGVILVVGTPVAYLLARFRFPGRALIVSLLELPIVLPPAVAGIGLLAAFGRRGLLASAGPDVAFTLTAVVLAVIFVSAPFYIRQAIAAFEAIDVGYFDAAGTLGSSPTATFLRVAIPLALPGLEAGSALALARGFGEFGATIMFAGSLQGRTQTLPLAVYAVMDSNFDAALALAAILIGIGLALLIVNRVVITWTTSRFG